MAVTVRVQDSECRSRVQKFLGNVCTSKRCRAASHMLIGDSNIREIFEVYFWWQNATHVHATHVFAGQGCQLCC